jgi:hypothetical protein
MILLKFSTEYCHVITPSDYEIHANTVTAIFCSGAYVKFSPYFLIYNPIGEKFGTNVPARDIVGYL